ncbi:hypothetical protein AB4238_02485 [Shewanella sp. 10N.286.45.A1]|uniref:hypothetical protein n=1 Tax=Shewanella sp. 10N.286.45.A1 TaxID=3229694 RepID=UPI0035505896
MKAKNGHYGANKDAKTVLLGIDNFLTFHKTYENQTDGKCKKVIHGPIEQPRLSLSALNKPIYVA